MIEFSLDVVLRNMEKLYEEILGDGKVE